MASDPAPYRWTCRTNDKPVPPRLDDPGCSGDERGRGGVEACRLICVEHHVIVAIEHLAELRLEALEPFGPAHLIKVPGETEKNQ